MVMKVVMDYLIRLQEIRRRIVNKKDKFREVKLKKIRGDSNNQLQLLASRTLQRSLKAKLLLQRKLRIINLVFILRKILVRIDLTKRKIK